jgi:hypothetical protein
VKALRKFYQKDTTISVHRHCIERNMRKPDFYSSMPSGPLLQLCRASFEGYWMNLFAFPMELLRGENIQLKLLKHCIRSQGIDRRSLSLRPRTPRS